VLGVNGPIHTTRTSLTAAWAVCSPFYAPTIYDIDVYFLLKSNRRRLKTYLYKQSYPDLVL